MIQILGPITPNRVGVLEAFQTNVIGEQEPSLVGRLEVQGSVLDLLGNWHNWLWINLPTAVQILSSCNTKRPVRTLVIHK